ncbi:isoeugenol synthase 1-like [Senna tora]|uniref:Isoeugenol synthase 1-like n=1 Tax=Senna tora TaxID=362788 RepID=A0A834X8J0_9FABA|nr:isoeugenol synthase 1-like [Senna tora]
MVNDEKSKILIIGATGYLGQFMVKASLSMAHPTFAYTRSIQTNLHLLNHLQSMGLIIFQGNLEEHHKLVSCLKQVDVVISTLAVPQHLEQLKLIKAMKEAGNIKRFLPSEYGNEVDRVNGGLPPFEAILENKRKIRRATEEAGIPFTYISANSFAAYFVNYLLHPHLHNLHHILVYGTGEAKVKLVLLKRSRNVEKEMGEMRLKNTRLTKAVLNYEEDVAFYTVKAAIDERARNRVVICRPKANIISQLELIALWENKTKLSFKREYVTQTQMVKLSHSNYMHLPSSVVYFTTDFPHNIPIAILHSIFVEGSQTSFELCPKDLEASQLYPDYKYTSLEALLDVFLINPPKPRLASFC